MSSRWCVLIREKHYFVQKLTSIFGMEQKQKQEISPRITDRTEATDDYISPNSLSFTYSPKYKKTASHSSQFQFSLPCNSGNIQKHFIVSNKNKNLPKEAQENEAEPMQISV